MPWQDRRHVRIVRSARIARPNLSSPWGVRVELFHPSLHSLHVWYAWRCCASGSPFQSACVFVCFERVAWRSLAFLFWMLPPFARWIDFCLLYDFEVIVCPFAYDLICTFLSCFCWFRCDRIVLPGDSSAALASRLAPLVRQALLSISRANQLVPVAWLVQFRSPWANQRVPVVRRGRLRR